MLFLAVLLLETQSRDPGSAQDAGTPATLGKPAGQAPPPHGYPLADEDALLAAPADRQTIWRFRQDPAVLIVIFPSLHSQALTLNRIAAFVEKAGLPHDRVIDDAELNAAIAAGHHHFDTYYEAHDYRVSDLEHFFVTADRDGVRLHVEEEMLRAWLAKAGLLEVGAVGAVISLPPPGSGQLDSSGREAVLRHELSHGIYFTDPAYAALVRRFWEASMSVDERTAFRGFLGASGYDTANEDLMRNEMQAYLAFTPDTRIFRPASVGLRSDRIFGLRQKFAVELPAGWLLDHAVK